MKIEDIMKDLSKEPKTIKQFKKKGDKLYHPLGNNSDSIQRSKILEDRLLTLGHLWIYVLIENNGYGDFLKDIIKYSIESKKALFEWELVDDVNDDIKTILGKYNIELKKYLNKDFKVKDYAELDQKAKNKDLPYLRLTRLLILSINGMSKQVFNEKKDLKTFLCDEGTIINAVYIGSMKVNPIDLSGTAPKDYVDLIMNNMDCYYDDSELKYYPRLENIATLYNDYEYALGKNWYLISDDEQVILSKFFYSIKLFKEIGMSLLAVNGITSAVANRIIFDNYWQSLYLINNNEVEKYREFVLDRLRLHILKREDDANIGELIRATENGLLDPIPINGDYFNKSAREYAISLNIKDDYDKYYEFNSEFIHASLTAVYSGIMVPCKNPEHDGHLTIKNGGARLIESIPGIIYLLNKHVGLVNSYCGSKIPEINISDLFSSRSEWSKEFTEK